MNKFTVLGKQGIEVSVFSQIFKYIMLAGGATNLFYLYFFYYLEEPVLLGFSIFALTFYLIGYFLVDKRPILFAYLTYFMAIIFTVLTTYFLGWGTGFHWWFFAIISMLHFIARPGDMRNYGLGGIVIVIFCGLYLISGETTFLNSKLLGHWRLLIVNFNIISVFLIIFCVGLLSRMVLLSVNDKDNQRINRLEWMVLYDNLTDVYNRRTMEKIINRRLEQVSKNQPLALVFADIDNFKELNDRYHHQFGDQILASVADILRQNFRVKDIVSRWGGEEFVVLLPTVEVEKVYDIVEQVRQQIEQTDFFYNHQLVKLTMTFGVVVSWAGNALTDVVEWADQCMYQGKARGKNQVVLRYQDRSVAICQRG